MDFKMDPYLKQEYAKQLSDLVECFPKEISDIHQDIVTLCKGYFEIGFYKGVMAQEEYQKKLSESE